MKYLSLLFLLSAVCATAQVNFHERIKKHVGCEDVSVFAIDILPTFIEGHHYDSIQMLLTYWERKCAETMESQQIRNLLSIQNGTFDEASIDKDFFNKSLDLYRGYSHYHSYEYYGYYPRNKWPANYENYLNAVEGWSEELKSRLSTCSDTYGWLLATFHEKQEYLDWLKNDCDNHLSSLYESSVDYHQNLPDTDIGLFLEAFVPEQTKHVSRLGVHPSIGLYIGMNHNRFFYRGTMSLKFVDTPEPYQVLLKDSVHTTDYFFGGFIGGEVGYTILKGKNHWLYLTGGTGLDGFGNFKYDEDDDDAPRNSINALNLNVGIGSKIFLSDEVTYLGYEVRYNRVNYKNPGGTNFDGNVITIRIVVGGFLNYTKQRNLDNLRAPYRN